MVELASFGSILLLCLGVLIQYGLEANYQQNLQMQTFRKALRTAYYKSGPAATVSLSQTEDKPMPDPRDPWGFPDRRPIGASASATWDSNAQAIYINDYGDPLDPSDLPRSIIEINNKSPYNTLGLSNGALSDGGIKNIDRTQGAFTTAAYGERGCGGQIMVVFENPPTAGPQDYYREVWVNCGDIRVKNRRGKQDEPGKKYAYLDPKYTGLLQTITAADIDGDGELENIIAVEGTQACDQEGYCGGVAGFKYVDFQEGEINNEFTVIYPWETNKGNGRIDRQQGLIHNYTVTKTNNNALVKTENPSRIQTITNLNNSQQIITHQIRENDGTNRAYGTTFTPTRLDSYNQGVNK